jgi:hypothetical protein
MQIGLNLVATVPLAGSQCREIPSLAILLEDDPDPWNSSGSSPEGTVLSGTRTLQQHVRRPLHKPSN